MQLRQQPMAGEDESGGSLHAERLARAAQAIEARDSVALAGLRDALWSASLAELEPLIVEAVVRADFVVLSNLFDALPFDRIRAAVPNFCILAQAVDGALAEPFLINLLVHRGAALYWPELAQLRRKRKERRATAATRTIDPTWVASAAQRPPAPTAPLAPTTAIAEGSGAGSMGRFTWGDGVAPPPALRAPGLIAFDDCLLAITIGVAEEGEALTLVSIDDALTGADARLVREQALAELDADESLRAMREAKQTDEREATDTLAQVAGQTAGDSIAAQLATLFAGDSPALHDPRVANALRAALARRAARAFDLRQRSRERESSQRAQSASKSERTSAAQARAVRLDQRARNGAELHRLAQQARAGAIGQRLNASMSARMGDNPLFLSPATVAANLATALGVPAAAMTSPAALVAVLGSANAARAFFSRSGVAALSANGPSALGLTPLHLAAMAGNIETVRELLAAGADAQALDLSGRSALDLAVAAGVEDADLLADLEEGTPQDVLREVAACQAESLERAALREALVAQAAHDAPAQTAQATEPLAEEPDSRADTPTADASDATSPVESQRLAPKKAHKAPPTQTQSHKGPRFH
ncbi:ankyrin repeat domain-containing protein [Burkholderia pseudomallei]|uniref:ankyrin repeat domain-containing protein n=1 Tax=Burkholderia pseudomallei TaxID=28450 RepID=UPI000F097A1A|nr:ankyrin repeat domain-containing protein [Burkholderia pseudomallei]CAJ3072094.1 ankyrin [Burkholderia pseudomallei]VCK72878.1 ankyrin [Burkholderia pseudomallei]VCK79979.1 ankyrin [Burkholderia pseudomallei]VCK80038.1 ankyrin [Burkholderia pseudomallei]VCK80799.1 ankyrin [Burkholderia pseudomallei]